MENVIADVFLFQMVLFQDFLHHGGNGIQCKVEDGPSVHVKVVVIPDVTFLIFHKLARCFLLAGCSSLYNQIVCTTAVCSQNELADFCKAIRRNETGSSTITKYTTIAFV